MSSSEFSGPRKAVTAGEVTQMPAAFGRYELTKLLAVGGMAEVFLARARAGGIERVCVIKRVLPRYSTSRQFVSMFIDEARITIGLDHEHIVRLFDFGQVDGAYFMALEYVDGCDLVDVLRAQKARGEGLPAAAAVRIASDTLRGLHHAHVLKDMQGKPMGIVHRDVSPQNIFLGWDGAVKIGDFGIADAKNKLSRTTSGTVKGKFSYMSPEQATGSLLDGRSDVWAMGVVLWEMLVGGRLFAGENPVDTMSRVMEAPIMRPSAMRTSVPPELDRIVQRALTRRLKDRYQSAGEMADDLDHFLTTQPCSTEQLASFLRTLNLDRSDVRVRGSHAPVSSSTGSDAGGATVALPDDPELRRLHLELRKEKNLWTLVDIAERHAELDEERDALSASRTAAAIFAHRGLVVPAICALHALRPLFSQQELERDLWKLAELRAHDRQQLIEVLKDFDKGSFFEHVRDADPAGFGAEETDQTKVHLPQPLFGKVHPAEFVRLGSVAVVEERPAGQTILFEGDRGDCLYAIGRGRALVHTKSAPGSFEGAHNERVYVAALGEGDFFGEISLLTRSPRTASVEAQTDIILLRLDREILEGLRLDGLVEFYKERVAELLLAKNPLVSALPPDVRRKLLVKSEVYRYKDEQMIVREGEQAGQVFFVMGGEVEVFHEISEKDSFPVFFDKLGEGQLFGEMAALQGGTRTASVRAIGDVELLAIDGRALADVLKDAPDVKILFEAAMSQKAADAKERIAETTRIFLGV
jgi:serine/threonine protein kinase/CRP-like cAMP-binding protein